MTENDFEMFKLSSPRHFKQWKFLVEDLLTSNSRRKQIFSGEVDMSNMPENWTEAKRNLYLKEEKQMIRCLVGNMSANLSNNVLFEVRFSVAWKKIEHDLIGDSVTRLEELTGKIRRMKPRKGVEKMLTYFRSIVEE